ncbi:hypothetical protein F7725_012375 [Dissostichus mawsoni]|uniref:Tankyrase n=1 Tax=Dissostichus mawsoni TaxID=36200 RepID=A0A7J5YNA8_DISMA|nr:hypothetical protein F7725_012375 [Dissostichus mawsoni]
MAVSRRSSQQQSTIQSPPRNSSLLAAPGSPPPMALIVPPESERECAGGIDVAPASPDLPVSVLPSSASFSTTTTSGGSGSSVSSPGSGASSPADGSSGGAFRELFEACRNGDVSRVKRLVDSVNVNAKDMAGRKSTPLHFAAGFGRKDVVEHLLQTGANVHARDDGGLIPLHNACSFGHAEVVSLLLCQGADPNARDNWNYTPLHEAAIKGKIDVCIVLLQHGADPNIRNTDGKSALDLADPSAKAVLTGEYKKDELLEAASGLVPLHNACSYGHFEVTELLLKHGACVNAMDLWQFTPLHEAASKNRVEVCSLLLSHGADPTLLNCHSKSAFKGHSLLQAAREADMAKVKKTLALEIISFKHPQTNETALVTELLLRKGANINEKNKDFMTPLHVAAERAHNDILEVLQKHGAKVNAVDTLGQTSLHRAALAENVPTRNSDVDYRFLEAAKAGDLDTVQQLCTPQNVNCRDLEGRHSTPLHFAAGYNRVAVVEYLLHHGADVHAKDKGGLVPLHNACSYGHYEVAELLVRHGASVNVADLWKFTPLHEAAAKGKYEICKLLLKDGDTDIQDLLRGDAALLDAAKKGCLARPATTTWRWRSISWSTERILVFCRLSSSQHVDIAALLIKYNTCVNATDKWAFTPLHEAAQKGRTQLCALLLAHGADPTMKNQEGQTALDLATLLQASGHRGLCLRHLPASTPSCLSAASSIDNLSGPLAELASASGSSGVADGASGTDRKEGDSKCTAAHLIFICFI